MDRWWLRGATGVALHAVLCAAGYNIRCLLRAIVRLNLKGLFGALIALLCMFAAAFAKAVGVGNPEGRSRILTLP